MCEDTTAVKTSRPVVIGLQPIQFTRDRRVSDSERVRVEIGQSKETPGTINYNTGVYQLESTPLNVSK